MSRSTRMGLFTSTALILVITLGVLFVGLPASPNARAASGPPTIDITSIAIYAPASGSRVLVRTAPNSFGNADSSTTVRVRNATLASSWSSSQNYSTSTLSFYVSGSAGDLIEVEATNGPDSALAVAGYVPAPSDVAPPDFVVGSISHSGTTTFTVTGTAGALRDNSFPVDVELFVDGSLVDTDGNVAGNSTESTQSFSVSGTATSGARAFIRVTDDYGNRSELFFEVGQGAVGTDGAIEFGVASSTQAPAEATGQAGMIPVGDGNSFVTAWGREFIHAVQPFSYDGPILDLGVRLTYRSGVSGWDGSVGQGLDWNLDARIEADSGDYYWYPGDGRRFGPFEYASQDSSYRYYDSPAGVFHRLKLDSTAGELYLETATGAQHVFDTASGGLIRIQDSYGVAGSGLNQLDLIRNNVDQVIQVRSGNGDVLHIGWYHHRRVASIRHATREVTFDYDTDGRLVQTTLANGAAYAFGYATGTSLLTSVEEVVSGGNVTVAENVYTSGAVSTHRNRHNPESGDEISFADIGSPATGTEVTDAVDAVTRYNFSASSHRALASIEWDSSEADRGVNSGYPGTDDPDTWRVSTTIDTDNYLPTEVVYDDYDGSAWTERETQTWSYQSKAASDPRLRSRVGYHRYLDENGLVEFTESWSYPSTGPTIFWPEQHTSFDGVITLFTYSDAGQLLTSTVEDVDTASTTDAFDIVSRRVYDSTTGQLTESYTPNRENVGGSPAPSMTYTYYSSTDPQYGRLEKTQQKSSAGANGAWAIFEYDTFGNVTTETRPSRTTSDRVTTRTFDALDRPLTVRGPDVTLTHAGASSAVVYDERIYTYSSDGFRLKTVERTHFDHNGSQGSGSGANPSTIDLQDIGYDSAGRPVTVERDFEYDTALERAKTAKVYNSRGEVIEEHVYTDASTYKKTVLEFDARGQLLRREIDPNTPIATPAEDPYEWFFGYDYRGRGVERFTPESPSDAFRTFFDRYGRQTADVTPNVTLDWNSSTSGYFETVQDYGTSYRVEAVTKYFHSGTTYPVTSPEELSTSSFTYDEAGRVHTTGNSYEGGQTVEPVDLYPDGSAHRRYIPYDSNATITWSVYDDNYSFTDLDAFDRVEYTGEQDGATALVRNRTIYHDATGWVTETQSARYHEADAATVTYKTEFEHDVLGRVIETRPFGTDTSAAHVDYTHFDGMGRVFETQRKNVAGTEGGVISNSFYNFAGQRTKELRGMSVTTGLFARTEWDYDLAGRRLEETRYDGGTSVSRTRSWTYDDLDRIALVTHPPQSTGTLDTDYEYGFDSVTGLPFTEQENPLGVVLRTERNELGHRLQEEVVSWGSSDQVGPAEVRLTYGGASGCGCTSVSKPTVIETIGENYDLVSSGDNFNTRVTRTFSPRGNILSEAIEVTQTSGGTLYRKTDSAFSFDAAGRKVQISYPDPPGTLTGAEVNYTHRQDGLVRTVSVDPDGAGGVASRTIGEYEYEGSQEIIRELRDMASGTQATVATVETTRDALGRLSEKKFSIGTNGGGPSGSFADGVDARTLDGQVEIHAQPPVSGLTNGYSKFEYGGAGWIVHQAWNATTSSATDPEHTQTYTRNGFGEIESMDDVETTPGCGTGTNPMYDETVLYGRDLAGNLTSLGLQGLTWNSEQVDTPTPAYTPVIWTDRGFVYDLNGRLKSRDGTRTYRKPCMQGCDPNDSVQGYENRVDEYKWDHELDVWGRRVLTERTSTLGPGSETNPTCDATPPGTPTAITDTGPNRVHLYVCDGLGRLVYSTTPSNPDSDTMVGFFHAYDGSTLLATHDVGSGNDSFIEFFNNPTSGTTDKYRIHRDGSGPNGVTGSAGPGWSSTSTTNYGTNLHGIWNNVILSNGAGDVMSGGGGLPFQDEGVFPAFTRLFLVSGEEVLPADPFSWMQDGDVFRVRSRFDEDTLPGEAFALASSSSSCTVDKLRVHLKGHPVQSANGFRLRFEYHATGPKSTNMMNRCSLTQEIRITDTGFDREDIRDSWRKSAKDHLAESPGRSGRLNKFMKAVNTGQWGLDYGFPARFYSPEHSVDPSVTGTRYSETEPSDHHSHESEGGGPRTTFREMRVKILDRSSGDEVLEHRWQLFFATDGEGVYGFLTLGVDNPEKLRILPVLF